MESSMATPPKSLYLSATLALTPVSFVKTVRHMANELSMTEIQNNANREIEVTKDKLDTIFDPDTGFIEKVEASQSLKGDAIGSVLAPAPVVLLQALGIGLPAAHFFDAVLGIDMHEPIPPAPPVPFPLPHVGLIFDVYTLVKSLFSGVLVNGFPAVTIDSAVQTYFPVHPGCLGASKLPFEIDNGGIFMGSRSVSSEDDPMSYIGLPALSCWFIGMPKSPKLGLKNKKLTLEFDTLEKPEGSKFEPSMTLYAPTSFIVPSMFHFKPVFVGGAPTIDLSITGAIKDFIFASTFGYVTDAFGEKVEGWAEDAVEKIFDLGEEIDINDFIGDTVQEFATDLSNDVIEGGLKYAEKKITKSDKDED